MNTIRKLHSPWVIVTLLLASYAASYFAVSEYAPGPSSPITGLSIGFAFAPPGKRIVTHRWSTRLVKHEWMVDFYRPMSYFESKVRRETVIVTTSSYVDDA